MKRYWLACLAILALAPRPAEAQAAKRSMGLTLEGTSRRLMITHVDEGGPADKAGLRPGDEVRSIAGIEVRNIDADVLRIIVDTAKVMKFVVVRENKTMTFNVQPGMYAPPRRAQPLPPAAPGRTPLPARS